MGWYIDNADNIVKRHRNFVLQKNKQGIWECFVNTFVSNALSAMSICPHKSSLKLLCAYKPGDVTLSAVVVSSPKYQYIIIKQVLCMMMRSCWFKNLSLLSFVCVWECVEVSTS